MASAPSKWRVVFTAPHKFPIRVERDVLEQEPPDPILTLDHVVFTPHYAAYTEEAYHELRVKTAENAAAPLEGRFPNDAFNPEVKPRTRLLQHGKPQ